MKSKFIFVIALFVFAGVAFSISGPEASQESRLVIHEWGTFTVLQDESGSPIPGVNINEESLPDFVHELSPGLAPDSHKLGPLLNHTLYPARPLRSKGIARFDPAVTMRLETPIIYIHRPAGSEKPLQLDVEVTFRQGWISEWFPTATCSAPGFEEQQPISSATTGRISWNGITVDDAGGTLPETGQLVWLAPRDVKTDRVTTSDGQTEKFLFYRGVANLEAPLRVVRSEDGTRLTIRRNQTLGNEIGNMAFSHLWLADIRADGAMAFREIEGIDSGTPSEDQIRTTDGRFDEEEYSTEHMVQLRASMRQAVVATGLYEDEADALLNTWKVSYFKSSGLRLFFLLPAEWTNAVLPLRVSQPAALERVMIGRIELVTPEQRELLRKIGAIKAHNQNWFSEPFEKMSEQDQERARVALLAGTRSLADFGITMPDSYRDYIAIGRFRDALVVDEIRRRGNNDLVPFADAYGLNYNRSW